MTSQSLSSDRIDFDDTLDVIEGFYERGWTDGLPIVPPTVERVSDFLDYVGRSPSEIVGAEPTKGRVITAEKVAINSVMAGCLPEYFPVVLAAVEAISEPQFNLHAITVSTMGAAVLMLVNGPITQELGLNSGVSVFGPGHRANATIGRAVRLVISNVTGAVSGNLDKATLGHPGKYTWCIAEAEDISPWEPFHVEHGFSNDQSAITVFAGLSATQVPNHFDRDPRLILNSFADAMFSVGPGQGEILVVLCPEHIGNIKAAGWSKDQVKQHLFERTQRTNSEWVAAGRVPQNTATADPDAKRSVALGPDNITVLVAGGLAGAFSDIIPLWGGGSNSRSVTKPIRVPS